VGEEVLLDGLLGLLWEFVLNEGVGDVVVLAFEDEGLDGAELAELLADVAFADLSSQGGTALLMLEM
jgi:hypothetical protein